MGKAESVIVDKIALMDPALYALLYMHSVHI